MNSQTFILAAIILCSLGGWYVVITKYLAIKRMIKDPEFDMQHIPGMGPPPVSNVPFNLTDPFIPPEAFMSPPPSSHSPGIAQVSVPPTTAEEKRVVCNYACMLHLLGFALVFGVPFLNAVVPALFWLWVKERHPFLAKQGREVLNFQITFSLIQLCCLGGGILFIRYMPVRADQLFAFTKIARIVFSSGMYMPFNVFTVIPFFWACIVMIRGAVAAYHGVNYKYPLTQQFIVANQPATKPTQPQPESVPAPAPSTNRVSFG